MGSNDDDGDVLEDLWATSPKPQFRFDDADALMSELLQQKFIDLLILPSHPVGKTRDPFLVDPGEFGIEPYGRPRFVEDFLQSEGCKFFDSTSSSIVTAAREAIRYSIGVELVTPETVQGFIEGSPIPYLKARVLSHRQDPDVVAIICGVNWALWLRWHDSDPADVNGDGGLRATVDAIVELLDERRSANTRVSAARSAPNIEWLRT